MVCNDSSKYASGGWTGGIVVGTDGTAAGCIAGVYMSGSTINRYWYGGTSYASPLMVILPGGNVGIGTTSPAAKLDVAGNVTATFTNSTANAAAFASTNSVAGNGWSADFLLPNLPANGRSFLVHGKAHSKNNAASVSFCWAADQSTSNYTGLGFYSNDDLLKVYATGATSITCTDAVVLTLNRNTASGACNVVMYPDNQTAYGWAFGAQRSAANKVFSISSIASTSTVTEMVRIDTNGNVTVVGGVVPFTRTASTVLGGASQDTSWQQANLYHGVICYRPSECVFKAVSSGGWFSWYVSGASSASMSLSTTGVLTTVGDQVVSSDATLKENWRDLNYSVADIAKTTAGIFDWKDGRGTSAGSKAQDWKALVPQLVHGEEGSMTLAYGQVALLNTILLARRSESHEERIKQLEDENAQLKKEIEQLRAN